MCKDVQRVVWCGTRWGCAGAALSRVRSRHSLRRAFARAFARAERRMFVTMLLSGAPARRTFCRNVASISFHGGGGVVYVVEVIRATDFGKF